MRERGPTTAVPLGFGEWVESAAAAGRPGDLRLLAEEARGFQWEGEGLRAVARAQYAVRDYKGALETWESLRRINPDDNEANVARGAIYEELGLSTESASEVFKVTGVARRAAKGAPGRPRVLVFTGHMIDAPGREKPRFPPDKEGSARQELRKVVEAEMASEEGVAFGIAGGASGGDILFHEVCAELGVPTQLYLALNPKLYVKASVSPAGTEWEERFRRLHRRLSERGAVCVLRDATEDSKREELPEDEALLLPSWLRSKPDYNIWQRTNLWMLHNALAAGGDDVTLIALWDRESTGDGAGGTSDLVQKAERRGAKTVVIDTKATFGL